MLETREINHKEVVASKERIVPPVTSAKAFRVGSATQPGKKTNVTETATNQKKKLMNAKSTTNVGTWNVRTLYKDGHLEMATKEMDRLNLDILGLCETRWVGKGREKKFL